MSYYYDDGLAEPTTQQQEQDDQQQDYSYSSCSLVVYQDGGGDGNASGDSGGNSSNSSGISSGNDNDSDSDSASWTEDSVSNTGTNESFSSGSASGSDTGTKDKKGSTGHNDKRRKWFGTLWTAINRMDGERKSRGGCDDGKRSPQHPVKTILRPPTKYVYVIGMSGLPSKVAVYPKRM